MKKISLLLLLLAAMSTSLAAQDMEQTAAPIFIDGGGDNIWQNNYQGDYSDFLLENFTNVTIENADEDDVTIYFRCYMGGYQDAEWVEYPGETINPMGRGTTVVEAYAVAPGKLPSDVVSTLLYYDVFFIYASCIVDDIHYYIEYEFGTWDYVLSDRAYVCSRKESQLYTPPYSGDITIPSEFVFRDETYNVLGVRDAAFASTFSLPCEITGIDLPSTIGEIGQSAFAGCTDLKRITLHSVTPPYAYCLFEYDYYDDNYGYYDYIGFDSATLYDQVTLFVPNESIDDYRNHDEWGQFTHIVPFIGAGPGDINGDGNISIGDATDLIDELLSGGDKPAWMDVNGDGNVSIKDITDLIDMLLSGAI